MRVVIIGGSGHVGTYLVPRLVAAGHTVVALSRGQRAPYHPLPGPKVISTRRFWGSRTASFVSTSGRL
ncbi:MAG: NAD-dependent epimerase/dehydratase family protein, partial [Chloroflexales bacterium]|nr:NAD-dependent epimerase/dehydratase family protein [Chloroflexales bacterium]